MNKKNSVWLTVILVLLVALITFQTTSVLMTQKHQKELAAVAESMEKYDTLLELDELFRALYVEEIDEEELLNGILMGYVYGTGDKYAAYYSPEDFAAYLDSLVLGEMQGIGVQVMFNADYGAIEVISVMPDSPALVAGVQPGDLIAYVGIGDDAESVAALGFYPAMAKLQGEAGTMAEFIVYRGDNYEEEIPFSIMRGYVTEQTVFSRVYAADPSIGIVRITNFNGKTPEQFIGAIETLTAEGCDKFVLDVRYNPGGELDSICTVLDYLLPEGPVIRTIDRAGKEETIYYSDAEMLDVPMVVLVNGSTASAGELFCSALQDYDKATLVGTVTYGKGRMQTLRMLSDGSGVAITYRYYCPPFSDIYDGIGVRPDIEIEQDEALANKNIYKITDEEDIQLHEAIKALYERAKTAA